MPRPPSPSRTRPGLRRPTRGGETSPSLDIVTSGRTDPQRPRTCPVHAVRRQPLRRFFRHRMRPVRDTSAVTGGRPPRAPAPAVAPPHGPSTASPGAGERLGRSRAERLGREPRVAAGGVDRAVAQESADLGDSPSSVHEEGRRPVADPVAAEVGERAAPRPVPAREHQGERAGPHTRVEPRTFGLRTRRPRAAPDRSSSR